MNRDLGAVVVGGERWAGRGRRGGGAWLPFSWLSLAALGGRGGDKHPVLNGYCSGRYFLGGRHNRLGSLTLLRAAQIISALLLFMGCSLPIQNTHTHKIQFLYPTLRISSEHIL